ENQSLNARAATNVDRNRRRLDRNTAHDRTEPCRIRSNSRLPGVAEDGLVNNIRCNSGTLYRFPNGCSAEFRGGQIFKRSSELSANSACCAQYYHFSHMLLPIVSTG